MKSYKKFQSKIDECIETTSIGERYEFVLSMLPYMKHYDVVKAQLTVLQISPVKSVLSELMKSGRDFYYGPVQSPFCSTAKASAMGMSISLKEMPDGSVVLMLDNKFIPEYFDHMDEVEKKVKEDPDVLKKVYRKLRREIKESASHMSYLESRIETQNELIELLQKEIRRYEKESLPSLGGESKH